METHTAASHNYALATLAHLSNATRVGWCEQLCPHTDSDDIIYIISALFFHVCGVKTVQHNIFAHLISYWENKATLKRQTNMLCWFNKVYNKYTKFSCSKRVAFYFDIKNEGENNTAVIQDERFIFLHFIIQRKFNLFKWRTKMLKIILNAFLKHSFPSFFFSTYYCTMLVILL